MLSWLQRVKQKRFPALTQSMPWQRCSGGSHPCEVWAVVSQPAAHQAVQRAAGPGLVSAFSTKHPAWHRKGSDVSLQVSCRCKCANDPEQPWLTLPCQTRAGGAMSHGCCLVNGTGCHGLLEHFKCPLGSWKLLGNGSLPPSSLPFFSTQSYRNSSTRETGSHSLTLFYEKSLVYFCNFLKVQGTSTVSDLNYYPSQVTLITTCPPGHEGLWI